MIQGLLSLVVLSSLTLISVAEPPAYGSSSDEFDINSISSYLGDEDSSSHKGASYSYNNYNGQSSSPQRFSPAASAYSYGQKSPVGNVPASSPYSSAASSYNPAYSPSSVAQMSYGAGSSAAANGYESSYDSNAPAGLGDYSNTAYSHYASQPLAAHGTNNVPFTALKPHHAGPMQSYSGGPEAFGSQHSVMFPTSGIESSSSHITHPYEGQEVNPYRPHGMPSPPPHRPPYPFEGPSQYITSFKAGPSPYNSFESGYSAKPPRHISPYKGISSGPPSHVAGSPGSHFSVPLGYKSPYYSDYKSGPGAYYSSRPPPTAYSGFKSPNSYESASPYKYMSDSPRYPRFPPTKYMSSSRPGYSGGPSKYSSYSSRPQIHASASSPYKSYSSKPPSVASMFASFAGLF